MSLREKVIFYSDVKSGKLQKNVSEKIVKTLQIFEGKRVEISIQKQRGHRSNQQNRLWWVYMQIIADETGHTKEEIHELCKKMFLSKPIELVNLKTGEVTQETTFGSTAQLNKDQFTELIDNLQKWAATILDIVLPDPDEQFEMNYD